MNPSLSLVCPPKVGINAPFKCDLILNTKNTQINAIQGAIKTSGNVGKIEAKTDDSIISLWVEKPSEIASNTVQFSGIIPMGFSGSNGRIFNLRSEGEKEGSISINLGEIKVLKNDGLATEIPIEIHNARIQVGGLDTYPHFYELIAIISVIIILLFALSKVKITK